MSQKRRIVDYPIGPWPIGTDIDAPEDARVLSAGYKNGVPVIFISLPSDLGATRLVKISSFYVIDDEEHQISGTARYVGTVIGTVDEGSDRKLRPLHVYADVGRSDMDPAILHNVETQGGVI